MSAECEPIPTPKEMAADAYPHAGGMHDRIVYSEGVRDERQRMIRCLENATPPVDVEALAKALRVSLL